MPQAQHNRSTVPVAAVALASKEHVPNPPSPQSGALLAAGLLGKDESFAAASLTLNILCSMRITRYHEALRGQHRL